MILFTLQQNRAVLSGIKGKYLSASPVGPEEILAQGHFNPITGDVSLGWNSKSQALVLIRGYGPNRTKGHTHKHDALVILEDGQTIRAYDQEWIFANGNFFLNF